MGSYYSRGTIAIPNVTGDIDITINAVRSAPEIISYYKASDVTADMLNKRYSGNPGTLVAGNGEYLTPIIDVAPGTTITFDGITHYAEGGAFPMVYKIIHMNASGEPLGSPYSTVTQTSIVDITSTKWQTIVGHLNDGRKVPYYADIAKIRFDIRVKAGALTINDVADFTATSQS